LGKHTAGMWPRACTSKA